jgi:formate-dependent nitrite reductase cytochrome c552 subunit
MKRMISIGALLLAMAASAQAQITRISSDVLGPHLNAGRGCTACHASHTGAAGNGNAQLVTSGVGEQGLWSTDGSALYGKTMATGGGASVDVLPASVEAGTPDVAGVLACLSCHDGNYASNAMMKDKLYEALPATYGKSNTVPTLLGKSESGAGISTQDHPLGLSAQVRCGGAENWDCTESNGVVTMNGLNSRRFVTNYGFFVQPGSYNNSAVVLCTTCHNPHSMNVVTIAAGANTGLPPGTYATMFFLRAPYNPNDSNPMSNQTAQFCRQCHADKSNEMNGSTAGTVF